MNKNTKNLYWAMFICAMAGENYASQFGGFSWQGTSGLPRTYSSPNMHGTQYEPLFDPAKTSRPDIPSPKTYGTSYNPTVGIYGSPKSPTYSPSYGQSFDKPATKYKLNEAWLPYDMQDPSNILAMTINLGRKGVELSEQAKAVLFDMWQFLEFLQKNVNQTDPQTKDQISEAFELVEGVFVQAKKEGIGSKGCYASVRFLDTLISLATQYVIQIQRTEKDSKKRKQKLDGLKKYLENMIAISHSLAGNSSTGPYRENTAKNLKIINRVAGTRFSVE